MAFAASPFVIRLKFIFNPKPANRWRVIAKASLACANNSLVIYFAALATPRETAHLANNCKPTLRKFGSAGKTIDPLSRVIRGCPLLDSAVRSCESCARNASERRRAIELSPIAKNSLHGLVVLTDFTMICAWTGEHDLAMEQLEALAKIPGGSTYGELRLSPIWDPLRGDPRFEKIVASLAPKETVSK
jgi:hypothetical protein